MINAVLIDDEEDARFLLRNQLEQFFSNTINIAGEADDVQTGIETIKKCQPNVVFLDIQMPQGTGFDLLQKIENIDFEVIFITAFNDYAIKAFEFSAFGYLMKPIKNKDLTTVIDRLQKHLKIGEKGTEKRLKILIENYGDNEKINKIVVSNIDGFQVLELSNVSHLEGDKNYTHFITSDNKKITSSKTLGDYETLLNEYGFFRIHQSTLVNLRHVKGFAKADGGFVEMKNGKELKLSRHRKPEFVKRFL